MRTGADQRSLTAGRVPVRLMTAARQGRGLRNAGACRSPARPGRAAAACPVIPAAYTPGQAHRSGTALTAG